MLPNGKAIRYGVTVGEEALAFSGVAKVGRKEEWPSWTPTADDQEAARPTFRTSSAGGPHNPLGARGLYLFAGNKDTLYRIHGTNQPEYIGSAISSGCIRMTNEDVIDLYNRVKVGTHRWWCWRRAGRLAVQSAHGARRQRRASVLDANPNGWQTARRWASARRRLLSGRVRRRRPAAPSSICTISGGTPSRIGTMLVPSPPDTIMWRSSSTIWP